MQSLMSVFHTHIQQIESESNSAAEVLDVLVSVKEIISKQMDHNFMPLRIKEILHKKHDGLVLECEKFSSDTKNLYSNCMEYLDKWLHHMESISCFMWMKMDAVSSWNDVKCSICYLIDKGVPIEV